MRWANSAWVQPRRWRSALIRCPSGVLGSRTRSSLLAEADRLNEVVNLVVRAGGIVVVDGVEEVGEQEAERSEALEGSGAGVPLLAAVRGEVGHVVDGVLEGAGQGCHGVCSWMGEARTSQSMAS